MSIGPLTTGESGGVVPAIRAASARVGVDFGYMLRQAELESALDPDARAATSSATGLYQFIDSTWLEMAERYGAKHGLTGSRAELLDARTDPEMAAAMAAEFAAENRAALEASWGGEVGATELYLAHFLGPRGAAAFLGARDAQPGADAAAHFPAAARANRAVFYDGAGAARSLEAVYERFAAKFEGVGQGLEMPPGRPAAPDAAPRWGLAAAPLRIAVPVMLEGGADDRAATAASQRPTSAEVDLPLATGRQQRLVDPVALMLLAQLDAPQGASTAV